LLDEHGIKHVQIISTVDDTELNMQYAHEGISKKQEIDYAKKMVLSKLQPFIGKIKNGAVIAADTSVFCKGRILEKPLTKERCKEQHEFLSGKTNINYTAYAVYYNGNTLCCIMPTKVKIKKLPQEVIDAICNEPEVLDCAGYRNQGQIKPYLRFKESHQANLTGLHVSFVLKMLEKIGFPFA
jgi:septum formation protein